MNDIELLVQNISLREVVISFGFKVKHNKIHCPFHADKSPSFYVYDGNRGGHCFGCNWHGSIIDFIKDYCHVSTRDAINILKNDHSIDIKHFKFTTNKNICKKTRLLRMENWLSKILRESHKVNFHDLSSRDVVLVHMQGWLWETLQEFDFREKYCSDESLEWLAAECTKLRLALRSGCTA